MSDGEVRMELSSASSTLQLGFLSVEYVSGDVDAWVRSALKKSECEYLSFASGLWNLILKSQHALLCATM